MLVLLGTAWWWSSDWPAPAGDEESDQAAGLLKYELAVVPFENLATDPDVEAAGLSLANEVLLRARRDWRVVPRRSSFQIDQDHPDLCQAAREMNVRLILEGTVSGSSESVGVSTALIECPGNRQVWSGGYGLDEPHDVDGLADLAERIYAEFEPSIWPSVSSDPESPVRFLESYSRADNRKGLAIWRSLVQQEPENRRWKSGIISFQVRGLSEGWVESREEALLEIRGQAEALVANRSGAGVGLYLPQTIAYLVLGEGDKMIAGLSRGGRSERGPTFYPCPPGGGVGTGRSS